MARRSRDFGRELGVMRPQDTIGEQKGGCMADEMGLGKVRPAFAAPRTTAELKARFQTVQMIAVIASNRSADPLRKTTLIVAPLALLDQWQGEIEMKTNLGLTCLIYHGACAPCQAVVAR